MNIRIGLIGYLGYSVENPIIGGQMSKTRGIYEELKKKFGENSISCVDTSNWKKEKAKLIKDCIRTGKNSDCVIIMPNKNGIKFILPIMSILKKSNRYVLIYPVVGGWLTDLLTKNKYLIRHFKKIDYILPETEMLRSELVKFTDSRIDVMPIFSLRKPVDSVTEYSDKVYKFFTFSRVTPSKGIDDAVEAIQRINKAAGKQIAALDVWGPVEAGLEEHYQELFKASDSVNYRGILPGDTDLDIFTQYYMMLFPTYYPGEGFPTTVCESFMAGLPVIASDWRFNSELVKDDFTGYLFKTHNIDNLVETINKAITNNKENIVMRKNALEKSGDFIPKKACSRRFDFIISSCDQGDSL